MWADASDPPLLPWNLRQPRSRPRGSRAHAAAIVPLPISATGKPATGLPSDADSPDNQHINSEQLPAASPACSMPPQQAVTANYALPADVIHPKPANAAPAGQMPAEPLHADRQQQHDSAAAVPARAASAPAESAPAVDMRTQAARAGLQPGPLTPPLNSARQSSWTPDADHPVPCPLPTSQATAEAATTTASPAVIVAAQVSGSLPGAGQPTAAAPAMVPLSAQNGMRRVALPRSLFLQPHGSARLSTSPVQNPEGQTATREPPAFLEASSILPQQSQSRPAKHADTPWQSQSNGPCTGTVPQGSLDPQQPMSEPRPTHAATAAAAHTAPGWLRKQGSSAVLWDQAASMFEAGAQVILCKHRGIALGSCWGQQTRPGIACWDCYVAYQMLGPCHNVLENAVVPVQALAECKAASDDQLAQMHKALDQASKDKAELQQQMLERQTQAQVRQCLCLKQCCVYVCQMRKQFNLLPALFSPHSIRAGK